MNITKYKRTKIESWKAYKQGSRPDASEDEMCPVHALHPYEGLLEGHSIYCNVFFFYYIRVTCVNRLGIRHC